MDENLVGYLLNALDPDTHRQVEDYLRDDAGARRQLEHLQWALEPLTADANGHEPAPGLWVRTLAHIAEDRCRRLPPAPTRVRPAPPRSWWKRADVLVAASLLLLLAGLSFPALGYLRHQHQVAACQENLGRFGQSLVQYTQLHGQFPQAEDKPGKNVAGIFVPVLHDAQLLDPKTRVACPDGRPEPRRYSIDELRAMSPAEFQEASRNLSGCYAYALPYWQRDDDGNVHLRSLRRSDGGDIPLMGDRPPFEEGSLTGGPDNSPNHNGKGQNVLFTGGHVRFLKERTIPVTLARTTFT